MSTRSACAPTAMRPRSVQPKRRAGFSESGLAAFSTGAPVNFMKLRSAVACVRVEPARTPVEASLASPSSTTTSLTPSL